MGNRHPESPPISALPDAENAAIEEAAPDYVTQLISLARLITSDVPNGNLVSVKSLLNLPLISCDSYTGPYVQLVTSMRSEPPTYAGADPINDITTVLSQLRSCVKAKYSTGSKIADFFRGNDQGVKLRQLLLLSKVVIECLSLWYAMQRTQILDDPGSEGFRSVQVFCKMALDNDGITKVPVEFIPDAIRQYLPRVQSWDGNLATVFATFSIDPTTYPAPILLIFNEDALKTVMQSIERTGTLPAQIQRDDSGTTGAASETQQYNNTALDNSRIPMTFMTHAQLLPFVQQYLQSGPPPASQARPINMSI